MKFFHRLSDFIEKVLNTFGGVLMGVSTLLAIMEVVCRYFFRFTHSWAEELIIYTAIYGVFMVAGPNLKRGIHINIDLLITRLAPKWREAMDFVANGMGLLTSLFLFYTGVRYVAFLKGVGVVSTSSLEAPMYLILLIFPIGMGLLSFFYFEKLIFLLFRSGKTGGSTATPYKGEL